MSGGRPAPVAVDAGTAAALLEHAPLLRAINFHNTPARDRGRHAEQLRGLGERYGAVDEAGLEGLFDGRALPHGRPGLVPVLYEAYRNSYEVVLDLVEREGLVAWVFVPSAFPDVPAAGQHAWARQHALDLAGGDPERVALTWGELRDVVARGHVVACHTATHSGIDALRTEAGLVRELVASKQTLEDRLGIEVRALAWLWGSPAGLDAELDHRLVALGYRFVFSAAKIQRLAANVPAR